MSIDETRDTPGVRAAELRREGPAVRPRDAASLIILRREGGSARVLMGRRASGHSFMPDKFVFPGGRVEPADGRLRPPHDLHPAVLRRLARSCSESRARALAMAAIRETWEETGLVIGESATATLRSRSPHWAGFLHRGINPRLDVLHYVARAITPPHRKRRFDARFFLVDAGHVQAGMEERPRGSGELLDLRWIELSQAQGMAELPLITRTVLAELQRRLRAGRGPAASGLFVCSRHGRPVVARE